MSCANVDVVIVGGGPFGLMLAIELGRRGVRVELFDEKQSTAFNPQANATQARTMEHYRRLGIAGEIRALGLPEGFPTDIAYFTRFARYELARFRLPSARQAQERVKGLSGSWSAAELPHRISQKYVERVLRRHAEALESVNVNFGWRLTSFSDLGTSVVAEVEDVTSGRRRTVNGRYLAAGDGARSLVRRQLGLHYVGETGVVRDFFGGRMLALYLRAPEFYRVVPHPPAWMNVTFNLERRAFMCAVDGRGEFAFHTQLRDGEDESCISDRDALAMFQAAVGSPIHAELLSRGTWTAGHALVATHFQRGRIMLGGDAVHLFTPAGGLGYNTAVEDAVNLGWKLAAAVKGVAGHNLLDTYEIERRPVAVRNTSYARVFAESLGHFIPQPGLEGDDFQGGHLRREAGAYLERHGKSEFNIPGVTFGARYDGSSIIVSDGAPIPPDRADTYTPTASPGGRAPHLWLDDGRSVFDTFGFEWTLLRIGRQPPSGERLRAAAMTAGMPLQVVHVESDRLRALYEVPLALIRPDQIVAWRGESDVDAHSVVRTVLGARASESERLAQWMARQERRTSSGLRTGADCGSPQLPIARCGSETRVRESSVPGRNVYLVGSVPMASTQEVFETVSAALGLRLKRLPDGETGERSDWITWLEPVFADNPAFEKSGEFFRVHASGTGRERYRLKPGWAAQDVRFDNLLYADIAKDSYVVFKRVKDAGKIPATTKFQVDLVPAHSVIWLFLVDNLHATIDFIYNEAVKREIDKITATIPATELAIQFDVASAVFARLELNAPSSYGGSKGEMQETFSNILVDLGNHVPADVELLYHLCYGDSGHRHVVEPTDMRDMVEFANRVSQQIRRPIQLIHMPVPRNRSDEAYFEPLRWLKLRPETELCLGLVHYTDGTEGTKRRLATAKKYVSDFAIATECGFGRRDPATIPELLRIHAEVADLA